MRTGQRRVPRQDFTPFDLILSYESVTYDQGNIQAYGMDDLQKNVTFPMCDTKIYKSEFDYITVRIWGELAAVSRSLDWSAADWIRLTQIFFPRISMVCGKLGPGLPPSKAHLR